MVNQHPKIISTNHSIMKVTGANMANGAKEYSDNTTLIIDLTLYIALRNNEKYSLGHFPKLTSDRWQWIVDNWRSSLFQKLKSISNGDEYLVAAVTSIDSNVRGWESGSRANPYTSSAFFAETRELLLQIPLDSVGLTTQENIYVELEKQRVGKFTSEDFRAMLRYLTKQRDLAFNLIGLGDPLYSQYKGILPVAKQRNFFVSDLDQLQRAIDLERFVQGILFEFKYDRDVTPNLLDFANSQIANSSDIQIIDSYRSYINVPFERSLEQMAQDYLGSSDLWYELITVNNLKPPYVDVSGVKITLLENASAQSLRIPSNEQERFRVGSIIKIGSRIIPEETRKVETVVDNQDSTFTLLLSGAADLSKLESRHNAYIRAFIPETIQEFSYVKIPFSVGSSVSNVPQPTRAELRQLDVALLSFGVDLALDMRSGDLILGSNGDLKLQFGIPNVQQAVFNIIRTGLNELPFHPEYGTIQTAVGSPIILGGNTATKIATLIEMSIKKDTRFTSVNVTNIVSSGTAFSIDVEVGIAGVNTLIPLSFVV